MAKDDNQEFSKRLKLALSRSPKAIDTAAELALQFNLRHPKAPITPQAAQKWLSGLAKPTSDKIETLATWLNVSTHWLQFGTSPEKRKVDTKSKQSKASIDHGAEAELIGQ